MSVEARGPSWLVRWREDGRNRSLRFHDRDAAETFDAEMREMARERRRMRRGEGVGDGRPCIPLSRGAVALVDVEDIPDLQRYSWSPHEKGYAVANVDGTVLMMHKYLCRGASACVACGAEGPVDVHHDNRDKLDNRRRNLMPLCRTCHNREHNLGRRKVPSAL